MELETGLGTSGAQAQNTQACNGATSKEKIETNKHKRAHANGGLQQTILTNKANPSLKQPTRSRSFPLPPCAVTRTRTRDPLGPRITEAFKARQDFVASGPPPPTRKQCSPPAALSFPLVDHAIQSPLTRPPNTYHHHRVTGFRQHRTQEHRTTRRKRTAPARLASDIGPAPLQAASRSSSMGVLAQEQEQQQQVSTTRRRRMGGAD